MEIRQCGRLAQGGEDWPQINFVIHHSAICAFLEEPDSELAEFEKSGLAGGDGGGWKLAVSPLLDRAQERCRSGRTGGGLEMRLGAVRACPIAYQGMRLSAAFDPPAIASCPARS